MVRIENEYLEVVISELGAQLQSIKSKKGTEFLYQGDQSWPRRSPVMFPYAGRLYQDKYTYRGREYYLQNHGFSKDLMFEVEHFERKKAVFKLCSNEKTLKKYPWQFVFHVTYSLKRNKLKISFKVENKSDETMRFGLGIHPGFIVGDEKEKTCFRLNKKAVQILLTDEGQRSGKEIPVENGNFTLKDVRIRKSFLFSGPGRVEMTTEGRRIIARKGNMKYFLLWEKGDDRFVCIEPWASLQDVGSDISDIEKIDKLCVLKENKVADFKCSFVFFENN